MPVKTLAIIILAVLVSTFVAVKFAEPSDAHVLIDEAYFTKGTPQSTTKLVISVRNAFENGLFRFEILESSGKVLLSRPETNINANQGMTLTMESNGSFNRNEKYTLIVYSRARSGWIKTDEKVVEMRF